MCKAQRLNTTWAGCALMELVMGSLGHTLRAAGRQGGLGGTGEGQARGADGALSSTLRRRVAAGTMPCATLASLPGVHVSRLPPVRPHDHQGPWQGPGWWPGLG